MSDVQLKLDTSQVKDVPAELRRGSSLGLTKATERGVELMRSEVPGGADGNLGKGISPEFSLEADPMEGRIIASAIAEREARTAILHEPSGVTKEIELSATGPYNYAEGVAEGTGMYGPHGTMISPQRASVLLIAVPSVRSGESYITDGKQIFIVRPTQEGMRPNDYPGRTTERLLSEVEEIIAGAMVQTGIAQ